MASRTGGTRRFWRALHLYLGLNLGLLLTLTGITGSVLVFYQELDPILAPELLAKPSANPPLSWEATYQTLRRAEPERPHGWRLENPENPLRTVTARYYKPIETERKSFAPLLVSVDRYTGQVVRRHLWGDSLTTWLYDLHYALLLDRPGKLVMAVIGGLLLIALISGLVLWWPHSGKWRTALTLKKRASSERLIYDLHKLAGVYGWLVFAVLAITGIALEIPEYVKPLVMQAAPMHDPPNPRSRQSGGKTIDVDTAVSAGMARYPNATLVWIETPNDAAGSYRINLRQPGEPGRRFPKTNVWIDQYSGEVLAVNAPENFSGGELFWSWLHPLHSGEAFGLPGRLLIFAAGPLCALLYATGLVRWLQKRRSRHQFKPQGS